MIENNGIKSVDFNQSLDCRLYTEEVAKKLQVIKIRPLRFSWDSPLQDDVCIEAIKRAKEYGHSDIRIDVLYNFDRPYDTPEYFYKRIDEINKAGGVSYPMTYRPIDSIKKKFIGRYWKEKELKAIKQYGRKVV